MSISIGTEMQNKQKYKPPKQSVEDFNSGKETMEKECYWSY